MVVEILIVTVHGNNIVNGTTIDVGGCIYRLAFFYALDTPVEVMNGVGSCHLVDTAVEGIVLECGDAAVVRADHAVAVVVLIGVVAIAEHIAIVVVLYGLPPNGSVSIHVVVRV